MEEDRYREENWQWYEESEFEQPTEEIHEDAAMLDSYLNEDTGKLEISNGASGWIRSDVFFMEVKKFR